MEPSCKHISKTASTASEYDFRGNAASPVCPEHAVRTVSILVCSSLIHVPAHKVAKSVDVPFAAQ
jgi:hypothetical protein